jgi:hypothetical protein
MGEIKQMLVGREFNELCVNKKGVSVISCRPCILTFQMPPTPTSPPNDGQGCCCQSISCN